jgi:hypothetical protein
MKIVKVIYSAHAHFVEQNKTNIKKVMSDLQGQNHPGIWYTSCIGADGKTFIHTAFFKTDADHQLLNELPSFRDFQEQLKAGGFETPPKQELLTLVGSSGDIFKK